MAVQRCLPWKIPHRDPHPDHLTADIDWMSISHRRLYEMATTGVDVSGATSIAAQWAKLGAALEQISAELKGAGSVSADGWQGEGADRARDAVNRLVAWTDETSQRATEVAGCVSRQAENAQVARRAMPEPPTVFEPFQQLEPFQQHQQHSVPRIDRPHAVPANGSTQAMSAKTPFSGGDFSGADLIMVDPGPQRERERELHRQAAEVMQRLQNNSTEVYDTVPHFVPPGDKVGQRKRPEDKRKKDDQRKKPDTDPHRPQPHSDESTTSSADHSSTGSTGPVVPGGGRPALGAGDGSGLTSGTPGIGASQQLGSGSSTAGGAFPGPVAPPVSPAAAGGAGGAAGQRGMTGMPMGGAGARGGGSQDIERKKPGYLEEDEDIFGVEAPVVPPVLGTDRRGGN